MPKRGQVNQISETLTKEEISTLSIKKQKLFSLPKRNEINKTEIAWNNGEQKMKN